MSKEFALCGTQILLITVRWRCSEEAGVVRHRGKLIGYHKRDLTLTLRDWYLVYRSVLMLGATAYAKNHQVVEPQDCQTIKQAIH